MAHVLQREGQPLVHVTGVTGKHEPFTVCSLEIESWSHLVYLNSDSVPCKWLILTSEFFCFETNLKYDFS